MNSVFVVEDGLPCYHGPISTSLEQRVAHQFSDGNGLIWTVQPSYTNKFRFITGIAMNFISQYKNEEEVLLYNQYLPITKTHNFENNIDANIDHLLWSLRLYQKPILNAGTFCSIIGLKYNKKVWTPKIETKGKYLYSSTEVTPFRTLLERLNEEMNLEIFKQKYNVCVCV